MSHPTNSFQIDCQGATVTVTPTIDVGQITYADLEPEIEELFDEFSRSDFRNIVFDLHQTDYFGSSVLSLFVRLWQQVRKHGGQMALCGVSSHELDILKITKLRTMWPIFRTRDEALANFETMTAELSA